MWADDMCDCHWASTLSQRPVCFDWGAPRGRKPQTTGGTEKAVAALEQQWLESQKTNNPDLVAPAAGLAESIAHAVFASQVLQFCRSRRPRQAARADAHHSDAQGLKAPTGCAE
jgi:hypothetical protein